MLSLFIDTLHRPIPSQPAVASFCDTMPGEQERIGKIVGAEPFQQVPVEGSDWCIRPGSGQPGHELGVKAPSWNATLEHVLKAGIGKCPEMWLMPTLDSLLAKSFFTLEI